MSNRGKVLLIPSPADFGPYRSLGRLEETTRTALASEFDLIEGTEPWPELDAVVDLGPSLRHLGQVGRAPTLLFALGNLPAGASLLWRHRARLSGNDVVMVNCTSDLAIFRRIVDSGGPRPALLPLGVDTEVFRPRGDRERVATRAALGIAEDAFVLIHAGRLDAQKNVHAVLQALRALAPIERRVVLVLAGPFSALPHPFFAGRTVSDYEQRLRDLIRGWGLEERVHITGTLGDEALARALSAADAFVSFTLHSNENFGYAPVEAMATGLPTVVAHWGGLKDTVRHGETGFHVETVMTGNGPRAAWRQAIDPIRQLAADPALRLRLGRAARDRAVQNYSLSAYSRSLCDQVFEAIKQSRQTPTSEPRRPRFFKAALGHWLTDVHQATRDTEAAARHKPPRQTDYAAYRWFQVPYASHDAGEIALTDGNAIAAIDRVQLDRRQGRLESLDPMWPESIPLEPGDWERLAGLEPGSAPANDPETRVLFTRLIERGIAFPVRPFQP